MVSGCPHYNGHTARERREGGIKTEADWHDAAVKNAGSHGRGEEGLFSRACPHLYFRLDLQDVKPYISVVLSHWLVVICYSSSGKPVCTLTSHLVNAGSIPPSWSDTIAVQVLFYKNKIKGLLGSMPLEEAGKATVRIYVCNIGIKHEGWIVKCTKRTKKRMIAEKGTK